MESYGPGRAVCYTVHTMTRRSYMKPLTKISDYHYVTRSGDILSTYSGKKKKLKHQPNGDGYPQIKLKGKSYKIHRLVASAFIPNPESLPQVNHINGIKDDNRVENLEWCNNSQNQIHAWKNGLQPKRTPSNAVLTQKEADAIRVEYTESGKSQRYLAKKYEVAKTTIGEILRGESYNQDNQHQNLSRIGPKRQMTFEDAEEIRRLYKTGDYSYYKLGIMYGVNHKTIKKITDYVTYKKP